MIETSNEITLQYRPEHYKQSPAYFDLTLLNLYKSRGRKVDPKTKTGTKTSKPKRE